MSWKNQHLASLADLDLSLLVNLVKNQRHTNDSHWQEPLSKKMHQEQLQKPAQSTQCPLPWRILSIQLKKREVGDSPYRFEGGNADIVAEVQPEIAIQKGDMMELDSDDDSDDGIDVPSRGEVLRLCETLEMSYLRYGNDSKEFSVDLPWQLQRYRAKLWQDDLRNSTQSLLDNYFIPNAC